MPSSSIDARPKRNFWHLCFLAPLARVFTKVLSVLGVGAVTTTLLSVGAAGSAAWLYWLGTQQAIWAGCAAFQIAAALALSRQYLSEQKEGWSSTLAVVIGETAMPWQAAICAFALGSGAYHKNGEISTLLWTALFVCLCFIDHTVSRILIKSEGAIRAMYQPKLRYLDRLLLRIDNAMARRQWGILLIGRHERNLLALVIGPLTGTITESIAAAFLVGMSGYLLNLWLRLSRMQEHLQAEQIG